MRVLAAELLGAMLDAADEHGFTIADFDRVSDLPSAALDVVAAAMTRTT